MQRRPLRSLPRHLREATTLRRKPVCSRASRRLAATISQDARHARHTRGGNIFGGHSVAVVTTQPKSPEIVFALIGHKESGGAAADVIGFLRGPEHPPLLDDEIKDILPWIPPRTVCHVEVESIAGAKARGIYIDSFIPPDRLEAAYTLDNLTRVRAAAACAIEARANIVKPGRL